MAKTARTLRFAASSTQNIGELEVTGSSGAKMTVKSTTDSTFFTLNKTGGGKFSSDYNDIRDVHVTNGEWYAGHNSTLISGNDNVFLLDYIVVSINDTVSLTENMIKKVVKNAISETASLTETFSRFSSNFRTFNENITLNESLLKNVKTSYAESIVLTESFFKSIPKTLSESITLVETFSRIFMRTVYDTVLRGFALMENGGHILMENGSKVLLETYDPETLEIRVKKTFSETITLKERLNIFRNVVVNNAAKKAVRMLSKIFHLSRE